MPARKKPVRRKKAAPASLGLAPAETLATTHEALDQLARDVERDGGAVIAKYLDPFGGQPLLLAALPIASVEPTPYQRDPSDAHVKRLMGVIERVGRFLDPIVAVRHDSRYWTPNGSHRLHALRKLGAQTVIALLVPDPDVAFKILALNTEKAHNLREKSLETIRMARALAARKDPESAFAFEFEQPAYLTLGACYDKRPRFGGAAYQAILRRVDGFLELPVAQAVRERERRGQKVLLLDEAVSKVVETLKARGFTSPYLRSFVVARVDYTRFSKAASFDFDEALDRIIAAARKFNVDRVKQEDVARVAGALAEE